MHEKPRKLLNKLKNYVANPTNSAESPFSNASDIL